MADRRTGGPLAGHNNNQQFTFTAANEFRVTSASATCLTLSGTVQAGTPVISAPCDGSAAQHFTVQYTNGTYGTIRPSPSSNLCVQTQGGGSGSRTLIELGACSSASTNSQTWRFTPGQ